MLSMKSTTSSLRHRAVDAASSRTNGKNEGNQTQIFPPKKVAATVLAGLLLGSIVVSTPPALAQEASSSSQDTVQPIYFGNGCFWGRQKDFIDVEQQMGRDGGNVSAVTGYAGGKTQSKNGKVCYYYANDESVYEKLGHAEVVKLDLRKNENADVNDQMRMFARKYFAQFNRTPIGMMRQDPQDIGAGYRNVIGLPGGLKSPLMKIINEENVNNMQLVAGNGSEEDKINVVYILDSDKFPFNRAENYHQFHNGLGKKFPKDYTRDLKQQAMASGVIEETGCPEFGFLAS